MGGIGKSSYRKIDKTEGQKAMPKVDDGATKVLRVKEEAEQLDELSPKTLNSYATKAQPDIRKQSLDPEKRKKRAKMVGLARFKALKPSMNKE